MDQQQIQVEIVQLLARTNNNKPPLLLLLIKEVEVVQINNNNPLLHLTNKVMTNHLLGVQITEEVGAMTNLLPHQVLDQEVMTNLPLVTAEMEVKEVKQ